MRRFILVSRTGRSDGRGKTLREAGYLDVVHQCGVMALFLAHGHRKDVEFSAVLMGPPRPPVTLVINGARLGDLRTDDESWRAMIPSVIAGAEYPGVYSRRIGLQGLIDEAAGRNDVPMVLHEKGEPIEGIHLGDDPVFVVGDQVGLAKKDEEFVMRRGRRVSLGRRSYLAAACVAVINHSLDRRESQRRAGG